MTSPKKSKKKAAAAPRGVVFTDCAMTAAARGPKTGAKRRPVVIKGKRAATIDIHAHCVIPEAVALQPEEKREPPGPRGSSETVLVVSDRLRAMDAQRIDMEVLSINPRWYRCDRDLVTQIVKIQNEKLAELVAAHPDRFAAFASVALQFPDLAVKQLEEAVKRYGFRGAAIGSSVAGDEFSHPKFHPVWAKAEELGVLLFIHPAGAPELAKRLAGNGWLVNTIGNPLDTTIALSHLIFEGTLDKFPGLKICAAHGGGYLASYGPRSDYTCRVGPCDPNIKLKKKPTEYLKTLYYDSLIFTSEALRHLVAEVGANRIMLGTDYPYPWQDKGVEHILKTPGLTDAQRIAMLGGTAAKLLDIKASARR